MVKLLFLPAKMSILKPEQMTDIFDDIQGLEEDSNCTEDLEQSIEGSDMLPSPSTTDISTDQPTDSESGAVSGNTSDQSTVSAALRIRTLSSLQEQPLNLSLNLPRKSPPPPAAASSQVLDSIAANLGSNPSTPATRTYSRKRKGSLFNKSLVLSFNELMAASETAESSKKTRKMPTIVPLNTRNNSVGGSDLSTSSIPSQTSNMVTYTTDPNQHYLHTATTHLQPELILPNIPATIEPVPSSAAGYPSASNVVRRTVHEPPQVSVIPVNASQPRRFFLPSRLPRVEFSALPSSVTVTPVPARNLQAVPYSSSSNGVFRYPAPVGNSQARHQYSSPVAASQPQPGGSGTAVIQQAQNEPRLPQIQLPPHRDQIRAQQYLQQVQAQQKQQEQEQQRAQFGERNFQLFQLQLAQAQQLAQNNESVQDNRLKALQRYMIAKTLAERQNNT